MHSSWKSKGGGYLGFLANSFEGGTWGCEKISGGGGSFLLHFYVEVFKNIYRGYVRCPPSPPPLCVSMRRQRENRTDIEHHMEEGNKQTNE
jgi:hypothetical protein